MSTDYRLSYLNLGSHQLLPEAVAGKRHVDYRLFASACALALAGIPASSWADSCTSPATTINSATNDRCTLNAGESVNITSIGSLTFSSSNALDMNAGAGNVTNEGTISGTFPNATSVFVGGVTTADIINHGTIRNDATTQNNAAIGTLNGFGVLNRITNTGLIESVGGTTSRAIFNLFQITNGIDNSGTIRGKTSGITNERATSTIGGIRNTSGGVIAAIDANGAGITNNGLISQGIVNSGTISGNQAGILNSGTISSNTDGYAIDNRGGTINGGISNSGILDGKIALDSASLRITGTTARVSGDISGGGTSSITIDGNFTAEAAANVGTITVNNAATLNFVSNQNWSGSNAFSNNGSVVIGTAATPGVTLTTANYTQSATGLLQIGASSDSNYGKLLVTGTANFAPGARINVDVATVNTLGINQVLARVISAGTLNASTFNISDNSALFNFRQVRNGNDIDLRVVANNSMGTGIRDAVIEQRTWSALDAARVLDTQLNNGVTGDMGNVINAFGQLPDNRAVARAATQTLPLASGHQAIQGALSSFQNVIQNRIGGNTGLSSGDTLKDKQIWGRVFGSRADQDDRKGSAGFSADSWGLGFGADAEVAAGNRVGLAYGYAKTSVNGNTDLAGAAQDSNISSHLFSAYGSKELGQERSLSWQADLGVSDNDSRRQLNFGGLNRTARADYRTYSAHVGATLKQQFALSETTSLTPALRADYTWLKSQSYQETGADALNLHVASQKTDALVLGADTYLQHRYSPTSRLDAYLGVGYDTINKPGAIVAAYAGAAGLSFVTNGIELSPWLVRGGIGYTHTTANGTEVSLRYDAEGRSDYLNQSASVRAKWMF
ncbi:MULTISPECIES: autotransporter domain-containing protein [Oxalobacteraceae]|uniref:autotransporter outer membrane beta-barrel domain-containing protein n=1 Tax=Herminiimonas sp. Marseille-P9896 TaxID=2742211 RepID=UPI00158E343C|nr:MULTISPECIES: autotransporter outer membrane beta-barrel domain-containing protein [Oxalobacteraceae]